MNKKKLISSIITGVLVIIKCFISILKLMINLNGGIFTIETKCGIFVSEVC